MSQFWKPGYEFGCCFTSIWKLAQQPHSVLGYGWVSSSAPGTGEPVRACRQPGGVAEHWAVCPEDEWVCSHRDLVGARAGLYGQVLVSPGCWQAGIFFLSWLGIDFSLESRMQVCILRTCSLIRITVWNCSTPSGRVFFLHLLSLC